MCVQAVCVQGCVCVRVYIVSNFAIHSHFTVSTSDRREGGGAHTQLQRRVLINIVARQLRSASAEMGQKKGEKCGTINRARHTPIIQQSHRRHVPSVTVNGRR